MITYRIITNQGDREINEDCAAAVETNENYCFLLADGLGGHGKGEIASALVVESGKYLFRQYQGESFLEDCFSTAQKDLMEEQKLQNAYSEMKTTMVALEIRGNMAKWGHIGDSRLYHFYKNKIVTRTLDHSVPQMLVMAGEIKEKQIRGHEDRNRLLRVMGVEWSSPQYTLAREVPLKECQAFLLCSDGFWELIEEKTMISLLKKSKSLDMWMEEMETEVRKNGIGKNMDNYTAIGIWIV